MHLLHDDQTDADRSGEGGGTDNLACRRGWLCNVPDEKPTLGGLTSGHLPVSLRVLSGPIEPLSKGLTLATKEDGGGFTSATKAA